MEVTPEIFAWLTSLNIINPFVSFSQDLVNDFQIPEKTVSLLMGGKYIDVMIQPLQEAYNKFYKTDQDYLSNLMKLKQIPDGQEYISNSLKYTNWKIIFEVLAHFGLVFSDDELSLLVNNSMDELKKVISKIYHTYTKYLNSSNDDYYYNKDLYNNKNNKEEELKEVNNKINNKINNQNNLININEINPLKKYEECNTLLEFMILSLCKNMNMKPRQAVTLLSKNRKYLKKICISGYNYNFQAIKNWLTDLYNNKEIITKLIINSEDGLNICYGSIGSALFCKDLEISLQSAQLLNIIKYKVGMNWDWFYNEGINTFIFIINKEDSSHRKEFLDLLYDFIKDNIPLFFEEIKKKFEDCNNNSNNKYNYGIKKSIYDFISNIISLSNNMDKDFIYYFQKFIYDICLTNNTDISYNLSILSDTFFLFDPIEDNNANRIIAYFKENIKSNIQNIFSTGILQLFNLMEKFGIIKNKYGPFLYKNIVFIFIEEYNNEIKRELFLENFEKFLNNNQDIPIDILLESYLNHINGCQNYALCDFLFLLKIIEHPRIEAKDIYDIIQFILNVCLNSIPYARCANLILSLIFEKELIDKLFYENDNNNNDESYYNIEQLENIFIDFINTALDMYISNITNQEDKFILETPYDIMTQNYENVNMQVKEMVVNCVKRYRKIKGNHSSGLLAMMWYYKDNDDIMMQIEELNRPIYEPMQSYYERKRLEQEERDKHDYTKKLMISLKNLRDKRMNILLNRQEINEQKKLKEERIKRHLMEKRRIIRLMSGIEARIRPQVLAPMTKMSKSNSDFYEQMNNNNLLYRPNKLQTGQLKSNMMFAVNNAAQNYVNKGVIDENSKFYQKLNDETSLNNSIKLKKSNSLKNIYQNKSQEEIMKQYGQIINYSEKKKKHSYYESELKLNKREEITKLLIQKEGSLITHDIYNKSKRNLLPKSFTIQHMGIPFDLEEEEKRELKAIKGYNKEYRKNLKYYFKVYSNESKQKITKTRLVRLLRDIGIDKEKIEYDEISTLIRIMFQDNFSEFDFNQFINLLVQLSYIIYTRKRPCLTIGETYSILLKRFTMKNINHQRILSIRKKYQLVIDYLLQLKEDNEQFNIPEGFKFVKNTYVKYNCRLAPHMQNYLGESKFICYQVLEEIIYDACKSSIIEPFVEVSTEEVVEIEPEKIHNWSPGLTMAYIDLDKSLKFHGIFAADALEDGIRKILKKNYELNSEGKMLKIAKGIFNVKWVKQDLERKKEFRRKQKVELERKKLDVESEKNKYKRTITKEEYGKVEEQFKQLKKKRKQKEEEKKERKKNQAKMEKEMKEKKNEEMKPFFKDQKKKLKEQFKDIKSKQKELQKEREEEEKKETEKYKRKKNYSVSEKEKNYNEFEKNINNSIKSLSEKEEIKVCLEKYMNHLNIIYDIYSKIGYNKISFYSKEVMHIDEFKQFLINFAILGVYITAEQMNWIFKNIAKVSQKERNNEMYFDFNDFKLSIFYLTIFSKYENKTWKMKPKDIEEMDEIKLENFLKNLGLKLPFDKIELEKFINERRSISMKNLLSLQHNLKLEEAKNHANNKNNKNNTNNNIEKHSINNDKNENEKNDKSEIKKHNISNKNKNDKISENKSKISNNNFTNNSNTKKEIKSEKSAVSNISKNIKSDNKKQNGSEKSQKEEEEEEEDGEEEDE